MMQIRSLPPARLRTASLLAGLLFLGCCLAYVNAASAATPPKGTNSLASEPPARIVTAAQSALRAAHGYVMAGKMTQGDQRLELRLTYDGPSKLEINLSHRSSTAAVLALPGHAYVKASRAYLRALGKAGLPLRYANRWIELPAAAGRSFAKHLGTFDPRTLARCLGENHGPLSRSGSTTVDGKRAVVIRDAGGVPGGTPGTLDVAAAGPAYPLRVTSTGPTLKGGKVDACNDGRGSDIEGSLTLSRFNHPPVLTAPAHAVRVHTTKNVV